MTRKSILLGTTALAGALAAAVPASAGPTTAGDTYTITLSGEFGFNILAIDQDVSTGRGRGYFFENDDVELYLHAAATADNGMRYGVRLELNANTDDTTAADEVWAYVSHDDWGHLELGENDDAADRMFVNAEAVMTGKLGWDGVMFDMVNTGSGNGITDSYASTTDDATKITYFTPRISGFQLGVSHTPDTGHNGRNRDTDNDGDAEKVWGFGANWEGSFGDVGVLVAATYETGKRPNSGTAAFTPTEDPEIWTIGAQVTFGGFAVAAGYADLNDTGITTAAAAAGADGGSWWDVGASYTTGPWTVSLAYLDTTKDNTAGIPSTDWSVISAGVSYNVAPGWDVSGELDMFRGDNINATATPVDNDGTVFLITNYFYF